MYVGVVIATVIVFALLFFREQLVPNRSGQPTNHVPVSVSPVQKALNTMSLRDKVASLFVFHVAGMNLGEFQSFVSMYNPGGIILMGDNIPGNNDELRAFTSVLQGTDKEFPRLVAVDQEGGTVSRLRGDTFRSAEELRRLPADATSQAFAARSELVRSAGITLNFGIVADVTDDPTSFIYDRVLGATPQAAAERVSSAVKATEEKTLSTLKHFPGHGRTSGDSHISIPTTSIEYQLWHETDALPFRAGAEAGADVVMFGHLRYEKIDSKPASLSKKWHETLRDDIGFKGVTITDDMLMLQNSGEPEYKDPVKNAVQAVAAGNSLLLYVLNNENIEQTKLDPNILIDGVTAAVKTGEISEADVTESARQVLELRQRAGELSK